MNRSLAPRSRTADESISRVSLALFFIHGYALRKKISSPSLDWSKKWKPRSAETILSCGSEVTVASRTGSPRAAKENAIWLHRIVLPDPGSPVTTIDCRRGRPPPSSTSRPAIPVGMTSSDMVYAATRIF